MGIGAYIGAIVSVLAGALGLLWPRRVSTVIGLHLPGRLGVSEFRATYGGLFIGAGLAVILSAAPDAALVLGAGWIGAFVARMISIVVDRSTSKENLVGCVIELVIGSAVILGR